MISLPPKEKRLTISEAQAHNTPAMLEWINAVPCNKPFALTLDHDGDPASGHGSFDIAHAHLLDPERAQAFCIAVIETEDGWSGIEPLASLWETSPGAYLNWMVERRPASAEGPEHIVVSFQRVVSPHLQGVHNLGDWQVFVGARGHELEVTYRHDAPQFTLASA
jgi:hypothetical protein